ncbi:hypothetical protein ACFPRL_10250 [Pseudoclavibacter helvolus]
MRDDASVDLDPRRLSLEVDGFNRAEGAGAADRRWGVRPWEVEVSDSADHEPGGGDSEEQPASEAGPPQRGDPRILLAGDPRILRVAHGAGASLAPATCGFRWPGPNRCPHGARICSSGLVRSRLVRSRFVRSRLVRSRLVRSRCSGSGSSSSSSSRRPTPTPVCGRDPQHPLAQLLAG